MRVRFYRHDPHLEHRSEESFAILINQQNTKRIERWTSSLTGLSNSEFESEIGLRRRKKSVGTTISLWRSCWGIVAFALVSWISDFVFAERNLRKRDSTSLVRFVSSRWAQRGGGFGFKQWFRKLSRNFAGSETGWEGIGLVAQGVEKREGEEGLICEASILSCFTAMASARAALRAFLGGRTKLTFRSSASAVHTSSSDPSQQPDHPLDGVPERSRSVSAHILSSSLRYYGCSSWFRWPKSQKSAFQAHHHSQLICL